VYEFNNNNNNNNNRAFAKKFMALSGNNYICRVSLYRIRCYFCSPLVGKSVSEITYFVSSETLKLNQSIMRITYKQKLYRLKLS